VRTEILQKRLNMLYLHSEQLNTTVAYQEEEGINALTIINLLEGNWNFTNVHVASLEKARELIPDNPDLYKPVSQEFFEDRRLLFLGPLMIKANLLLLEETEPKKKRKR
jgi:hypothetical protein